MTPHLLYPMHRTPLLFFAGLLVLGAGCSATREAPADSPGGREPPAPPAAGQPPAPSDLTPECAQLHAEIVALDKGVPEWFVNVKRSTHEIEEDMRRAIELSRRFLAECGESPPRCEVKAILARILMARNTRYATDLRTETERRLKAEGRAQDAGSREAAAAEEKQAIAAYFQEIAGLAKSVTEECKEPARARHVALRILFDLAQRDYRWEDMRGYAKRLLVEKPEFDYVTHVHFNTPWSYMAEGRYPEAVRYLNDVLEKHSGDAEYALYVNELLPALIGAGELKAAEELMLSIRVEYPGRMAALQDGTLRSPYGEWYYGIYEQWYYNSLFWIGYLRFALGDIEGARKVLEESVAEVDSLEAKLAAQGKKIASVGNGVVGITRDFRTANLLSFIKDHHGRSPEMDFDLGDMWATENRLSLKDSPGKVVAIVFRMPKNSKVLGFLQEIDALVKERGKDLAGIVLGYQLGTPNPEREAQARENMRKDLLELGVSLPAGFDPDRKGQRIIHAFRGSVGPTATAVFLDRKGRMAWYILDPRDVDRRTARLVLERLLAEQP